MYLQPSTPMSALLVSQPQSKWQVISFEASGRLHQGVANPFRQTITRTFRPLEEYSDLLAMIWFPLKLAQDIRNIAIMLEIVLTVGLREPSPLKSNSN